MHTTPLNKHGLPLLPGTSRPTRTPYVVATPPSLTCQSPGCHLPVLHTIDQSDRCESCQELEFEHMIWRTY